jgi:hypothetical protein
MTRKLVDSGRVGTRHCQATARVLSTSADPLGTLAARVHVVAWTNRDGRQEYTAKDCTRGQGRP